MIFFIIWSDKSFLNWMKENMFVLYSFNSCYFRCMSLWRRGNVLTCHPLGPRSIPGVGIHLITEAFNWLCILAYSDESRKHFLTQVSHLIRIGCINQFVYMFFFVSVFRNVFKYDVFSLIFVSVSVALWERVELTPGRSAFETRRCSLKFAHLVLLM